MKRIFYNENLNGSGLVTGRAIRFIRDSDGAEIDLSEIGQTGKYLADPIEPGIWSVWDVTNGSPGVDLDQKVDVLSSTLVTQQITFPVPQDGNVFLAGDETFKTLGIGNVSGLASAIAAKQDEIATGNAAHAYFGNKVFRAIASSDLPSDISSHGTAVKAMNCEIDGIPGALMSAVFTLRVIEIEKSKAYVFHAQTAGNENFYTAAPSTFYPRRIKATPSFVLGDLLSRFLGALSGLSAIGYASVNNIGAHQSDPSVYPCSIYYDGTFLWVEYGKTWRDLDMYANSTFIGAVING